jgi:hypothetical protein
MTAEPRFSAAPVVQKGPPARRCVWVAVTLLLLTMEIEYRDGLVRTRNLTATQNLCNASYRAANQPLDPDAIVRTEWTSCGGPSP